MQYVTFGIIGAIVYRLIIGDAVTGLKNSSAKENCLPVYDVLLMHDGTDPLFK